MTISNFNIEGALGQTTLQQINRSCKEKRASTEHTLVRRVARTMQK